MDTFHAPERSAVLHSGAERDQLESWLDFLRSTLLVKCDGLTDAQLTQRPVATSLLSLLGIVRHLTFVEQVWFETTFAGLETADYYKTTEDRDADFGELDSSPVSDVFALYDQSVARSRELATGHDLNEMTKAPRRGREVDLRWIYLHLIEEYARHLGHADIVRELIDGVTGY